MTELLAVSIIALAIILGFRRWRSWKHWQVFSNELEFPYPDSGDMSFTDSIGKVWIGDDTCLGQVRCVAQNEGLCVKKISTLLTYAAVRIPWSAIRRIEFGRKLAFRSDEGDYRGDAILELDVQPSISITVPWRTKFDQVVPSNVQLETLEAVKNAG